VIAPVDSANDFIEYVQQNWFTPNGGTPQFVSTSYYFTKLHAAVFGWIVQVAMLAMESDS